MITFELTRDKINLEVVDYDEGDLLSFKKEFKKLDKSYFAKRQHLDGMWDGYENFLEGNRFVKSGLWYEVVKHCSENNIKCNVKGLERVFNAFEFDEAEFDAFVKDLLKGTEIDSMRHYQIDAAKKILKYKYANAELATASGKTLVLFVIASWLKWKGFISRDRKMIITSSRVQLLNQIDHEIREKYSNGMIPVKTVIVGGKKNPFKQEKYDEVEVCIISHQSLPGRDSRFFKQVEVFAVDEAHTSKGKNIPNAIMACDDLLMRFGVSGTIKVEERYSTFYKIQQYLGPLVTKYEGHELISDGFAPDVNIKMLYLNYRDVMDDDIRNYRYLLENSKESYEDVVKFGNEMYNIESRIIRENRVRLNFIRHFSTVLEGNCLFLYKDVKTGYGKRITEEISKEFDKTYYVDGDVEVKDRERYTELMNDHNDIRLVASYGTFSTGINLKNVLYIVMCESFKAEILIKQVIGRGMREFTGKHVIYLVDLIDTFGKYGREHARERNRIYKKAKYPVKRHEIVLKP